MSHKQTMTELRQLLERWKSHNEVHAKPADQILYEFFSKLLNAADAPEEIAPTLPEATQDDSSDDETGPGGNSPDPTPDLP